MSKTLPSCHELTAHRVNGLNEALRVFVLDGRGPGGASHDYVILTPMSAEAAAAESRVTRSDGDWDAYQIHQHVRGGINLLLDGETACVVTYNDHNLSDTVIEYFSVTRVRFQCGPVREAGFNGVSNEALLAILINRMEGFQTGDFKCHDNQVALDHLQGARLWLHKRTMDRTARGVEGTSKA